MITFLAYVVLICWTAGPFAVIIYGLGKGLTFGKAWACSMLGPFGFWAVRAASGRRRS